MSTLGEGDSKPNNIFINAIDSYISSHIGKKLLNSVLNERPKSKESNESEEETSVASIHLPDFNNNIFCTLSKDNFDLKYPANVIEHCKYFIYNITDDDHQIDEAMWIAEKLYRDSYHEQERKEDDTARFTDLDYRRRKAHQNYFKHMMAEKEIKRLGDLSGWMNSDALEVIGEGINLLPTIHINDLASIIFGTMNMCPTTHYILAVDEGNNTQLEIVKAISKALTTGRVKHIAVEEAERHGEITQSEIDNLTINLRLEAQFVRENMSFKWFNEDGIVESIKKMVREFKLARNLIPIRICLMGPPLSGKSTLAQILSDYYSIPRIHVKQVIEDRIKELEEKINKTAEDNKSDTETDSDMEEEDIKELLEEIQTSLSTGKGRLNNSILCSIMKRRLNSKECQNHGYILDGFPKTVAQANLLFEEEKYEESDNEDEENKETEEENMKKEMNTDFGLHVTQLESESADRERAIPNLVEETFVFDSINLSSKPNTLPEGILPACAIFLQASDLFLISRALHLPLDEVQHDHNDEKGFLRRLAVYRSAHAGSEVAAIMAREELKRAVESNNLLNVKCDDGSSLSPCEQIVPLMAGSVSPNSLLAYFEDKRVKTLNFDISTDASGEFDEIERKIRLAIGPPRNYGTICKKAKIAEDLRLKREEEQRELERSRMTEELGRREAQRKEMADALEQIEAEEEEALLKVSEPLRKYLAKYVMPTLSKGIYECILRRPEDPVDYLAEYLFKNNPQVD